jgi:hypothetical protein
MVQLIPIGSFRSPGAAFTVVPPNGSFPVLKSIRIVADKTGDVCLELTWAAS